MYTAINSISIKYHRFKQFVEVNADENYLEGNYCLQGLEDKMQLFGLLSSAIWKRFCINSWWSDLMQILSKDTFCINSNSMRLAIGFHLSSYASPLEFGHAKFHRVTYKGDYNFLIPVPFISSDIITNWFLWQLCNISIISMAYWAHGPSTESSFYYIRIIAKSNYFVYCLW